VRLVPSVLAVYVVFKGTRFVRRSSSKQGSFVGRRLNGNFSHLAYVRLMKFSVAPESRRAGASVLCARRGRMLSGSWTSCWTCIRCPSFSLIGRHG